MRKIITMNKAIKGNLHAITEGNIKDEKHEEEDEESGEESTDDEEDDKEDDEDYTTISEDDEYNRFTVLQGDIVCSIHDKAEIPKSWILLYSQSTVDVFSNKKFISNIRESKRALTLYCKSGKVSMTQENDLKGYGTVW